MIAKRIAGANRLFGPPPGHEQTCSHLAVRIDGDLFQSAWEPTPAELAILNAGGHVILSVKGWQAMVRLHVEPLQAECAVNPEGEA
jgi:hypothetical protein